MHPSVHEAHPSRPTPDTHPSAMFAMTTRVATLVVASAAAPGASASRASRRASTARVSVPSRPPARLSTRARAEETAVDAPVAEDEFESRLGALRGKRSKRAPVDLSTKTKDDVLAAPKAPPKGQKRRGVADFTQVGTIDEPVGMSWGPEVVVFEGPPARGEIVANVAMSWTLVWLPLTIGAIGRGLWSSYKITDKRVCVMSTSPLRTERSDVPMDEIVDVISIGRGIGLWGDMVITLRNQEKIELRSLPDFKKLEEHIRSRMGEADPEYAKL